MKLDWSGPNEKLGSYIAEESEKSLEAYARQPKLVDEHANQEEDTARGGYAHRQLFELVQNSADALSGTGGGRIEIRLSKDCLYCADNGEAIDQKGVNALMFAHLSPKRETSEIGRFGLGFKSVLGVTDSPEFFSRSGSFRFDHGRSRERIRQHVPNAWRCPTLRLPDPIDPCESQAKDNILCEFMDWATNIVRLPLKCNVHDDLVQQMQGFPPEFLLFVEHVRQLTLKDDSPTHHRTLMLKVVDGEYRLTDNDKISQWKLFKHTHKLSDNARADKRSLDDGDEVPIWWAAPLNRLADGAFWAFFPTKTANLLAGILNAPWKTNEDRQNLLPGPYNDELIKSAVEMIAEALPQLATENDPARHLDALPRRQEAGDSEHSDQLRTELFSTLHGRAIIPDQNGKLCASREIKYPPKLTTDSQIDPAPFDRWAAYPGRPSDWLHHKALTRKRLATIGRLYDPPDKLQNWDRKTVPSASIAEWLEALIEGGQRQGEAIMCSKAAIQTAAFISFYCNIMGRNDELGKIVLTADNAWQTPNPDHLFLPDESLHNGYTFNLKSYIHSELASDNDTLSALKKLGLKPPSPENSFRRVAKHVVTSKETPVPDLLENLWILIRGFEVETALTLIRECQLLPAYSGMPTHLHIRTRSGNWRPLHSVLLPGRIVPDDGSRDGESTVDTDFHELDLELLRKIGVIDAPCGERNLSLELWFPQFSYDCYEKFRCRPDLGNHRSSHVNFVSPCSAGPLEVLKVLSDEGKAIYTDALLSLDATYEQWTMRHAIANKYPEMSFKSPVVWMLRKYGQVKTMDGIVPFSSALGPQPNPATLHALLAHPNADKIRATFDLAEPTPEFIDEEDPELLIDIWPGLEKYLPPYRKTCQLIRCGQILVGNHAKGCISHSSDIYLASTGDERQELRIISNELKIYPSLFQTLRSISNELKVGPNEPLIDEILDHETQQEIKNRRAIVKQCSTDAERLLAAVGESKLRTAIPSLLIDILSDEGIELTGVKIAEAAIATYHSGALKQYKWALGYLDPPTRWAGSKRAVDFVQSLGFSTEWAGDRNRKRPPFLEVEGPYSLPELHDYQKAIVNKVRSMLRGEPVGSVERRGMISIPTGSGKTRVAVQAIVEAMCHDGFDGGILWVADRDELCEQAVEAWRQVWSSIGVHAKPLRISRMWAGQPDPRPINSLHVVVATIQTLHAKLGNQRKEYAFLENFQIVVFDEAHRSIARIFTSVMQEIGLTRLQRENEPFLLGLTATPYRGHDEKETNWLAGRYGKNRLDAGAFASDDAEYVVQHLQKISVLAQADHEIIEGGEFSLNPEELQEMESAPWLPQSVESRIAEDSARTRRIIKAYEAHIASDWPTLIFATSVEHAQAVAALLNTRGIESRAVSGTTEPATRRRVVEEFRCGEIRALVNYGVFREGFDAPRTRAIIVARPVYSPNLYFQMIGRGLRGVKNGGNNRCLILNVRDNIINFQKSLAFSDLDWLWT